MAGLLLAKLDSILFDEQQNRLDDIIEIIWIKEKFLQRLSGDVNIGANYAKSSNIFTFNFSGAITYRLPKNEFNLKGNSVLTNSSADSSVSIKQDVNLSYYRRLERSFYLGSNLGWEENTELGLKNRFSLNGVGGKVLISNNHNRLLTGIGLSLNKEQSNKTKPIQQIWRAWRSRVSKDSIIRFLNFLSMHNMLFFPALTIGGV